MPLETAADRAAFVDVEAFGMTATYIAANQAAVTLAGIFDAPFVRIDAAGSVPRTGRAATFCCRAADLPSGAAQGDGLRLEAADLPAGAYDAADPFIGTLYYAVRELQPDGTGMVLLELEQAQLPL